VKVTAIIPAAGVGKRFSPDTKKQFVELHGHSILRYTLQALNHAYPFHEFVIGAMEEDRQAVLAAAGGLGINSLHISQGGAQRRDTVYNALLAATGDYVAVHDSVRPFVSAEIVQNTIARAIEHGGAICGIYAIDTIKRTEDGFIAATLNRDNIFMAHTPQVFHRESLISAMKKAIDDGIDITDEAGAYEYAGLKVKACASSADNIKITRPEDLPRAMQLFEKYFPYSGGGIDES
jgi:2-C-methyl-D-erythritol 4-phosphate cytidylyltransferase